METTRNATRNEICPIGSTNKPLYELKNLVAMLERDEEAKRQREERTKKAG